MGRNFAYKPIVLKTAENMLGKTEMVEVMEASTTYLKGKLQLK